MIELLTMRESAKRAQEIPAVRVRLSIEDIEDDARKDKYDRQRARIIRLFKMGKPKTKIVEMTGASTKTVYKVLSCYA